MQAETKKPRWHPDTSRKIRTRLVVTGDLILQTAASFSNGGEDDIVDIPLLVDDADGYPAPLLTGASLAGALRGYVAAHASKLRQKGRAVNYAVLLFGAEHSDDAGEQSPLIIDNSVGENGAVEYRNGVKLNAKSRTAANSALYDRTLWAAGTRFPLRFELLISKASYTEWAQDNPSLSFSDYEAELKTALATALYALESEALCLGGRKSRGNGRAKVETWEVRTYDMTSPTDLESWLKGTPPAFVAAQIPGVSHREDERAAFTLTGTFALAGSLLIRTEGGSPDDPDVTHQRARQAKGNEAPLLAGTSIGGALRGRAFRIVNAIPNQPVALVAQIFGSEQDTKSKDRRGSRLQVSERAIRGEEAQIVQSRVSIDRFTGGARNTALFTERPVFSRGNETTVQITLRLQQPGEAEIGLLLLLLKDLWTEDLPIGGEISVGRGRWRGLDAALTYRKAAGGAIKRWRIAADGDKGSGLKFEEGDPAELQPFVDALNAWTQGSEGATEKS